MAMSLDDILSATGISRATLYNYINRGVVSPIRAADPNGRSQAPLMFPDDAAKAILAFKARRSRNDDRRALAPVSNIDETTEEPDSSAEAEGTDSLHLHPVLVLSREGVLLWHNGSASSELLGDSNSPNADGPIGSVKTLAQSKVPEAAEFIGKFLEKMDGPNRPDGDGVKAPPPYDGFTIWLDGPNYQSATVWQVHDTYLAVFLRPSSQVDSIIGYLSRHNEVVRRLTQQRLPVFSHVSILMADLQDSTTICAELPADEYFSLINDIWIAGQSVLHRFDGLHGKHAGDGLVMFFLPQNRRGSAVMAAVQAAWQLRNECEIIDRKWRRKKRWDRRIKLNISLHCGEEWVGFFISNQHVELAVLGDTINQAARLCDFARDGAIWISKSAMSKLTPAERAAVVYGVYKVTHDAERIWVDNIFTQIRDRIDHGISSYDKIMQISNLAVAEISEVAEMGDPIGSLSEDSLSS